MPINKFSFIKISEQYFYKINKIYNLLTTHMHIKKLHGTQTPRKLWDQKLVCVFSLLIKHKRTGGSRN